MLSMINRGRISDLAVVQEFEHLIGRLRGFLTQSFDEDGNLVVADPNLAVFDVGDIKPTARPDTMVQTGWVLCDGSQISRVTYKSLFDVVGVTYGVGDGSTTFNVPDMRQRFPLGKAASGTGNTLGATGGSIDHTHTFSVAAHTHSIATQAAHDHTVNAHTHNISADGSHDHTASTGSPSTISGTNTGGADFGSFNHTHAVIVDTSANHTHGGVTSDTSPGTTSNGEHDHGALTGSGGSTSSSTGTNNPPYMVVNYVIFAGV